METTMNAIAVLTLPMVPGSEQVIIPSGTFDAPNGAMSGNGPWVLNDQDGQALVDKLNSSGIDVVVDYEHQTMLTAENGKPAPAAGWLLKGGFVWNPELGLVATAIRWTNEAAEMIREGEYRYISPVFSYNKKGVPLSLLSVALTNTPALTQLQELAIASIQRGSPMETQEQQSTNEQFKDTPMVTAIQQPPEQINDAPVVVASLTTPAQSTATASALQHPMIAALTNQVAALGADNAKLRNEMAVLQNQLSTSARDGIITAALSDGRLLPAMEKWARAVSIEELSDYLGSAQPIVAALTATQTQGKKPVTKENESGLSDDDLAICNQMQIDPKVFIAQRSKESNNARV